MKPVIVNFIPLLDRSIVDIRHKRDSDLAAGLTAYRVKKEKKASGPKKPRIKKGALSPESLAILEGLDPATREIMMKALSAK